MGKNIDTKLKVAFNQLDEGLRNLLTHSGLNPEKIGTQFLTGNQYFGIKDQIYVVCLGQKISIDNGDKAVEYIENALGINKK